MQPQVAARLLENLPSSIGKVAMQRLARITEIPTQALQEISTQLQGLVDKVRPAENAAGSKSLASILEHLNGSQREEILSELAGEHPGLAVNFDSRPASQTEENDIDSDDDRVDLLSSASQMRDTFESSDSEVESIEATETGEPAIVDFTAIEQLPSDAIRRILAEVEVHTAIKCLCGMDARTVHRVLALLPRDQSREVRDRLKQVQHLELREIDRGSSGSLRRRDRTG
ncbi:MAG: hypothetical protein R3C05_22290 [Pirellulaceae bacterium]